MNLTKNLNILRKFIFNRSNHESVKWQICYFGVINTLETLYIIARPYMASDHGTYRVFIMDEKNPEEILVTKTSVHVSSKSICIETTFGSFSYNNETLVHIFTEKETGQEYILHEWSFLN